LTYLETLKNPVGWLMLFIFVRSLASSTLFSAEMALFPKLLKGEMLKKTNEIHSIVWSVCFALGMAVGGVLTHFFGFDSTFLIDVILYIIASFLLIGLRTYRTFRISKRDDSGWIFLS